MDVTEQLKFEENPCIKIKNKKYEVNADATTVIEVMGLMSDEEKITPKDIAKMCSIIFTDKAIEDLAKLKLKFNDYVTVCKAAINLITGNDEDESAGE